MTTPVLLLRIASLVTVEGVRSARVGEAVSLTPVAPTDLQTALAQQELFERIRNDHQAALWNAKAVTQPLWDMYRYKSLEPRN